MLIWEQLLLPKYIQSAVNSKFFSHFGILTVEVIDQEPIRMRQSISISLNHNCFRTISDRRHNQIGSFRTNDCILSEFTI